MNIKIFFFIGFIALGIWYWYDNQPVTYGPGQIAIKIPIQKFTSKKKFKFRDDYEVIPKADFDITARVLSRKRYWMGKDAELVPVDLALGWGPMSDEKVLDELVIGQRNRWFFWRCKNLPIPKKQIQHNAANMHLIPADDEIESRIKNAKKGNLIKLKGYLVRIEAENGWYWQSSLSRTDTGGGACEVIFVTEFEIIDPEIVLSQLNK